MNSNLILKLITVFIVGLLGACTSMTKLPDGTYLAIHGVSNINHATSYSARWKDTGQKDAEGNSIMEEVKVDKILSVKQDGTPIIAQVKTGDITHGPSVAGQMAVATVGGVGAALINGNTARAVARIGQCAVGAICGPVYNNYVQSVAEALNENKVRIGVNSGSTTSACAATNTCGN